MLNEKLTDAFLVSCFSTGKDELILQFLCADKSEFQWNVKFVLGEMYFRFGLHISQIGKKGQRQFKSLENSQVKVVKHFGLERALSLEFHGSLELIFAGFGRMGDVICIETQNQSVQSFRNHNRSIGTPLLPQFRTLQAEDLIDNHAGDLQFLSPEMKLHLEKAGFNVANTDKKWAIFNDFETQMLNNQWHLDQNVNLPALSYFSGSNKRALSEGLTGIDDFASTFIHHSVFNQEKEIRIKRLEKDLAHFKRLKTDNEQRALKIKERRSYKELGDIVMSFAHSIKPGVSSAFLTDYYTGNPIRIKLNPDLSAAENAEKYYRKAKNENLELQHCQNNVDLADQRIKAIELELSSILQSQSFKQLAPKKNELSTALKDNKPYKEVQFMEYTLWIGKNAKGNDEMLKLAAKNDLWLHARNVAGSHVIVKKRGSEFPQAVIQHAAQLAAQNSKAKSQKIVPVIVAERKYVSKGKRAQPGEVRVMKEEVVDAYLD